MSTWMQVVITLCVVAATVVLIPMVITLRRSLHRVETVMLLLEQEVGPLAGELRRLTEEARTLVRQGNRELERLGVMAERVSEVSERIGHVVNIVSGFTRVGQVLGIAAGLKKGLDVFIHRMRRGRHNHG
jgi:uncharacterized protein YoxC